MSLLLAFPFSWFFCPIALPRESLPPLSFFMLFETLLPLTILSLLFFLLLLLSLFSSSKLRKHSVTSPSTLQCFESASSFSFQIFISSRFVFVVVSSHHACWKVSVNLFELLSAAPFTCASVASLVSLRCRVYLTTRSLPFVPASVSRLSSAHNRCDEFF